VKQSLIGWFVAGGCFAVYLEFLTVTHLQDKLAALYRIETNQIYDIFYEGPTGVRVLVTDSVSDRGGKMVEEIGESYRARYFTIIDTIAYTT